MALPDYVAEVAKRPACDFGCGNEAKFDGRTVMGPWAYMCLDCWPKYGVGRLGLGYGQKHARAPATKEGGE